MAYDDTATITSGEMLIVDPCYIAQDCEISLEDLKKAQKKMGKDAYIQEFDGILIKTAGNGEFTPEVEYQGGRVSKVTFRFVPGYSKGSEFEIGECGVDSGQMMFVDPRGVVASPFNYDELCLRWAELDYDIGSIGFANGIISSTGWGDGCYKVSGVVNAQGLVAQVSITFIGESCETCGEECEIYSDGQCYECATAEEAEECFRCGRDVDEGELENGLCDSCIEEDEDEDE